MSLAAPEEVTKPTANAEKTAEFVCNKSESLLSVIEKCLDNGLGTCLIVEDDQRLIGRISLDDIRQALVDGTAIVDPTVGWHLASIASMTSVSPLRNDLTDNGVLQAVVDLAGHLTGVVVDRSTPPVQVGMPALTRHEVGSTIAAVRQCR